MHSSPQNRTRFNAPACAVLVAILVTGAESAAQPELDRMPTRARNLLEAHCFDCHSGDEPEAGLNLDRFERLGDLRAHIDTWEKVLRRVSTGSMPPPEMDAVADEDRRWLSEWIDTTLHHIDCSRVQHAGSVTIRRLTRLEYQNSIRDLLLVDYEPAASFPADDAGYGFDNIGDVLSLPPLLMEKYLLAAEAISRQVIVAPEDLYPQESSLDIGEWHIAGSIGKRAGRLLFFSNGEASYAYDSQRTQPATLRIKVAGQQAGDEPCKMTVHVDQQRLGQFEITAVESPQTMDLEVQLTEGKRTIRISFDNDYYHPTAEDVTQRDRNLIVFSVSVVRQPAQQELMGDAHRNFFFDYPHSPAEENTIARKLIAEWSTRCFRRPTSHREVERLFQIYHAARTNGVTFESGMQDALQAMLISPHFLYKVERPAPADGSPRQLDNYELATNLSYFLWSSTPDRSLLSAARRDDFQQPAVLRGEIDRLLDSPQADQLIKNFAVQWLQLRILSELRPDPDLFKGVDPQLLSDMREETTLFVREILRENRSLLDLLSADFTFVNHRLAQHYGLDGVPAGDEFVRVSLAASGRRGLLTQGSFLTLTSNPTRTSPVKRGKWILENLLAQPPPPAPPNVTPLEQQQLTGSLREQLRQHRRDAACATCHDPMDPLGFALENYDAVGRWRETEDGEAIDASGQLPSGETFSGASELVEVLLTQRRNEFVRCITGKMLTYALGRGLRYEDQCAVEQITGRLAEHDYRIRELVYGIVNCTPFRQRQSMPAE